MKKILSVVLVIMLVISIGVCVSACKKDDGVEITTNQEVSTQKTETTKEPQSNKERADELKKELVNHLDSADITGELEYGMFTYKYNRDPSIVYANEHNEWYENLAKDAANELVNSIAHFYPDEITLYQFDAVEIGNGDSGIDSVRYEFCYTNSQYQKLTIYADSDGMISYVNCEITW